MARCSHALVLALGWVLSPVLFAQGFESLAQWIAETPAFSEDIGAGALRADMLQELEMKTRSQPLLGPVASPSCTAMPTITDFFEVPAMGLAPAVATAPASAPVEPALLKKVKPSLAELWTILRSTHIGSAILKKFEPKYGYEVRVVFSDLKANPKRGTTSAALYRPADQTIVIQHDRQAGQIAFVLLHEMVHALDGDYRRALEREKQMRKTFISGLDLRVQRDQKPPTASGPAYRKPATVSLEQLAKQYELLRQFRDMRVYRAERFAYDASYQAWVELSTLYPEYYQGRGLSGQPQRYTDQWLGKILKIRGTYLDKYRKGECRAVQNFDNL
jgi:hypothetical protein